MRSCRRPATADRRRRGTFDFVRAGRVGCQENEVAAASQRLTAGGAVLLPRSERQRAGLAAGKAELLDQDVGLLLE